MLAEELESADREAQQLNPQTRACWVATAEDVFHDAASILGDMSCSCQSGDVVVGLWAWILFLSLDDYVSTRRCAHSSLRPSIVWAQADLGDKHESDTGR
ncbi:hypothetical protein J6590_034050 [Homalodisca vitripennis]|nr:hypothetical protein J6590_034050 [Homalodisca vitripennis]